MGLIWDFVVIEERQFNYPKITGVFFSDQLEEEDWGKISGTTGRNTKVSGMTSSGKRKMGKGWIILINEARYISAYAKLLKFPNPDNTLFS